MTIHIHCPTDKAIALVGFRSTNGLLIFPSNSEILPGIHFDCDSNLFINDQIKGIVEKLAGERLGIALEMIQDFAEPLPLEDGSEATLYLAVLNRSTGSISPDWRSLPELIRKMPKDKKRIVYIKAWQILSGGL